VSAAPVVVTHSLGRYPVHIASGLLDRLGELLEEHLPRRRLALVTDGNVAPLIAGWTGSAEPAWGARLVVPPGEGSKTREQWSRLSDALLEARFGRDSGIVAVGGGMVGDLAGFVAATYLRGVPFVQVPTTLLAMVDASVGGKTGVDTPHGKNLIGAFHPPAAVLADPRTLLTLPDRELRTGLAEAVKHGLIADAAYFGWIEAEADRILRREPAALERLVRRSVEIKAAVVGADEREAGLRATLNAGHTVAHALEHATGYGLAHGEAVSIGLVAEARLAERLGLAPAGLADRVAALLARLDLPVTAPAGLGPARLLGAMRQDKKNRAEAIRFALPAGLGSMHPGDGWTVPVPEPLIAEVLAG
jgi:3-dehydroquinate synthase